jgi:hypothetical protein
MAQDADGQPVTAREDLQSHVRELAEPLVPYAGASGARIRLGVNIAHHDDAAADLEGYARPLWGLAPLGAGGGDFAHWDLWARGLAAGTDPGHPDHWGTPGDLDQRLVETAAIGFALALVPERLWDPLSGAERDRVAAWLTSALDRTHAANNWNFFPVLVSLGLDRVGVRHDRQARHARLDRLETYALGDGWYADGDTEQRDYYIPWAMHYYGLIYAALAGAEDPDRAARFRERAATFAAGFRHWFADDGAAVPFGRSLTYRFAQGAFWGALPYADVDALPPGEVKGLLLRHLRWWRARHEQTAPEGLLSIGYGYPQPGVAEQYNGPGSPYWAMKAFLPLALPAGDPFWTAEEQPPAPLPATLVQPHAGAVLMRSGGDVTLLSGRQHNTWARGGPAKYAKFAYSTRFGFSLPAGELGLVHGAYDSMLAVSDDVGEPVHFRVREQALPPVDLPAHSLRGRPRASAGHSGSSGVSSSRDARTEPDGTACSTWYPWPDVEITSWISAAAPWHLRTHRIRTGRALHTAEGGFAVDRDGGLAVRTEDKGSAVAVSAAGDLTGLRDLDGTRAGTVIEPLPGTNVLARRTALPMLTAELPPGEHWLRCAVLGAGIAQAAVWDEPPPQARH